MEADWEIEIGGGAPVIEAHWSGFVDLRQEPERARELPEVEQLPSLADALIRLNAAASSVWTAKCDLWPLTEFDPDELDARREIARHAVGCYIDLLPRNPEAWRTAAQTAEWCRALCDHLGATPLRCCRVDLVVRFAVAIPKSLDHGVTAYMSAAGRTPADARRVLAAALAVFADSIVGKASATETDWKLQ